MTGTERERDVPHSYVRSENRVNGGQIAPASGRVTPLYLNEY